MQDDLFDIEAVRVRAGALTDRTRPYAAWGWGMAVGWFNRQPHLASAGHDECGRSAPGTSIVVMPGIRRPFAAGNQAASRRCRSTSSPAASVVRRSAQSSVPSAIAS